MGGCRRFCSGDADLLQLHIRPHMGINGMTPAQMANIPINLMGNRWEMMIGLAAKNNFLSC
jgi:hypothetical protein